MAVVLLDTLILEFWKWTDALKESLQPTALTGT